MSDPGLLILSGKDVDQVITQFTPNELVQLMAKVFVDLNAAHQHEGDNGKTVVIPHRSTIASANHNVLFMPARLAPLAGTAIKLVSVPTPNAPPDVRANGLPASTMVLDEQTGQVSAVVNARKLTALRNAASSLLATTILFSRPPERIVAIGAGAQIATHLSLFLAHYPSIKSAKVFNRTAGDRLQQLLAGLDFPGVELSGHALTTSNGAENRELKDAIGQADIVITATSSTKALFPSSYVSAGTHFCLIGSYTPNMHEVDTELISRAGKVVVDYRAGAASEAGELIKAGVRPEALLELGELIDLSPSSTADRAPWSARAPLVSDVRRAGGVTIFKSVGVGVQDVAITQAVVQRAKKSGLGTIVPDFSI